MYGAGRGLSSRNGSGWSPVPGGGALANHGGEPCSYFRIELAAGRHNLCCTATWGTGIFLLSHNPDL